MPGMHMFRSKTASHASAGRTTARGVYHQNNTSRHEQRETKIKDKIREEARRKRAGNISSSYPIPSTMRGIPPGLADAGKVRVKRLVLKARVKPRVDLRVHVRVHVCVVAAVLSLILVVILAL